MKHNQHPSYLLSGGGEDRPDLSSASGQFKRSATTKLSQGTRTRPTNNQLLYRATFHWNHYRKALVEGPKLPDSTEACASVTSAFLQVVAVLFDVEKRREIQPRNVLRQLATNTRRTKVVELSSGTHRVPEELKRHSIQDGEGGHYSTNLDRNRYGSDDQYLATVVRYNLDYLDICPCLVGITILDAKGGNETTTVSVDPCACICNAGPTRMAGPGPQSDARQQRVIRTVSSADNTMPMGNAMHQEANELSRHHEVESAVGRDRLSPMPAPIAGPRGPDPNIWNKTSPAGNRLEALLIATEQPQDGGRKPIKTPSMQFLRPRRTSAEGDSFGDSDARFDRSGNEPLRRSNRKASKRSRKSDEEWEKSDSDRTSYSGDDDDGAPRRDKGSDRWHGSGRMKVRRNTPGPGGVHRDVKPWPPESRGKLDYESLQQENWQLRQQLQQSEQLLEASRKREELSVQHFALMQQEIAVLQAQTNSLGKDKNSQLGSEAMRVPNGNLATPLHGMVDINSKENEAAMAKMMADRNLLCAAFAQGASSQFPFTPTPDLSGQHRNGDPASMQQANLQMAAQNAASQAQLQAMMRGGSAFSIPNMGFPQPGMMAFPQFAMPQRPQGFDMMQSTPAALPKPIVGENKPSSVTNTPSIPTPARPGTLLKPLAVGPGASSSGSALQNPGNAPNGTPERDGNEAAHPHPEAAQETSRPHNEGAQPTGEPEKQVLPKVDQPHKPLMPWGGMG